MKKGRFEKNEVVYAWKLAAFAVVKMVDDESVYVLPVGADQVKECDSEDLRKATKAERDRLGLKGVK